MGIFASSTATGTPPAGDRATEVVTGAFTATGVSPFWAFYGYFNVAIWGTFSATTALFKSFDGGTTWIQVTYPNSSNTAVSVTASTSLTLFEPEKGVLYQLNCGTYVSGTQNYRMSTTGTVALTESF
jgi:hypothetical protein